MGRITAISSTNRDPTRATIRVDGRVVATLPRKDVEQLGLTPDQPWSHAISTRVAEAVAFDKAMRGATARLNRRMMSRHQLAAKLRELGHDQDVVTRVLDRLAELKMVDDYAFGQALIRRTVTRKGAGAQLLRAKLMQSALDEELIKKLIGQFLAQQDPVEDAVTLAHSRLGAMGRLDLDTRRRRLWGLLGRRGFDRQTIEDAMDRLRQVIEE